MNVIDQLEMALTKIYAGDVRGGVALLHELRCKLGLARATRRVKQSPLVQSIKREKAEIKKRLSAHRSYCRRIAKEAVQIQKVAK